MTAVELPRAAGEAVAGAVSTGVDRPPTDLRSNTDKLLTLLDITVRGTPVGQGRVSFMGKGRAVHSNAATLKPWREVIAYTASRHMGDRPPYDGPVALYLLFTLPKPKTAKRVWPDRRPDVDHLARAVADALSGVVFSDDARIVGLSAWKFYPGQGSLPFPGVEIVVEAVPT